MSDDQLANLMRILEGLKKRPQMYVGFKDPELVGAYLAGVSATVDTWLGLLFDGFDESKIRTIRHEVFKSRGWTHVNVISAEMSARGMSPDEIIEELVLIEMDVIKKKLASTRVRKGKGD